jgi:hypothetical protein
MSVQISPISARSRSVGAANDPYKKYWWAILAGFVVTGMWLCVPVMETPVGSIHVDTAPKPGTGAAGAEQTLDAADNPSGAPGGALDLSMDGRRKSKSGDGEDMTSMLYQAVPEAGTTAAAGKPLGGATAAASSASLAQQLKDAGKKTDASGWNEKAQRGFTAPHLAGGLSGSGSASGGSSASASASSGNAGIFGAQTSQVGFGSARGLHDDGSDSPGFAALKTAAGKAGSPNLKGSDEAMHASMSQSFDGGKGKPVATIGTGAMAQANAAYDSAPANLKANDPKLDSKKLPDPPTTAAPPSSQDMTKQLAMMAATALIGGMIPGVGGQMVMMMGMMMMQQQQQAAAASAAQSSATTNQRYGT